MSGGTRYYVQPIEKNQVLIEPGGRRDVREVRQRRVRAGRRSGSRIRLCGGIGGGIGSGILRVCGHIAWRRGLRGLANGLADSGRGHPAGVWTDGITITPNTYLKVKMASHVLRVPAVSRPAQQLPGLHVRTFHQPGGVGVLRTTLTIVRPRGVVVHVDVEVDVAVVPTQKEVV